MNNQEPEHKPTNKKKMTHEARGAYIPLLVMAEIASNALIQPKGVIGFALVCGGAALLALFLAKLLLKLLGLVLRINLDFYTKE